MCMCEPRHRVKSRHDEREQRRLPIWMCGGTPGVEKKKYNSYILKAATHAKRRATDKKKRRQKKKKENGLELV